MKFKEWIKLREMQTPQQNQENPARQLAIKANPKADLDNIRGIVLNSDSKTAKNKIKQYYGNKIKKGTNPVQIAGDANDMNQILDKLGGK